MPFIAFTINKVVSEQTQLKLLDTPCKTVVEPREISKVQVSPLFQQGIQIHGSDGREQLLDNFFRLKSRDPFRQCLVSLG